MLMWCFRLSFHWRVKLTTVKFVKLGRRVSVVYLPSVRHMKSLLNSAASQPSYVGKELLLHPPELLETSIKKVIIQLSFTVVLYVAGWWHSQFLSC